MSGLMYAVKGHSGNPPIDHPARKAALQAAGLGFVADLPFDCFGAMIDNEPCWVYNPHSGIIPAKPKYWPTEQRWEDFGGYLIGCWTKGGVGTSPPEPEDLARKQQAWSYSILMADGNHWRVPVVPADLPQKFRFRNGSAVMETDSAYQDIIGLGTEYWDVEQVARPLREEANRKDRERNDILEQIESNGISDEEKQKRLEQAAMLRKEVADAWEVIIGKFGSIEQQCMDCCRVLGINYYVRPEEVSFLGILDPEVAMRIIYRCFIDGKAMDDAAAAKKKG